MGEGVQIAVFQIGSEMREGVLMRGMNLLFDPPIYTKIDQNSPPPIQK